MNTENLSTLKIHKLTQEQYNRALEAGNIDENALYLTPDEISDLSGYATIEYVDSNFETKEDASTKFDNSKTYTDEQIVLAKEYAEGLLSGDHNHDDVYYTEVEIDQMLLEKADAEHTHDISDIADLQTTLDGKVSTSTTINSKMLSENITLTASDVGADVSGSADTVQGNLDTHVSDLTVHITTEEKNKLNSIEAGAQVNKVTGVKGNSETDYRTGDINITKENIGLDKVDNTSDAEKPVSTLQQEAIDGAVNALKDDLLNGAGEAYDTLKELGDLIDDNVDAIEALTEVATNKANAEHTHAVSEITDLIATATELNYISGATSNVQVQLDGKANSSHTHAISEITDLEIALNGKVSNAITINNKSLSENITLEASDVGAANSSHTHAISEITDLETTLDGKAASYHTHSASDIDSGELSSDRLSIVPITKGGTGATDARTALTNLGFTATVEELNKLSGVTVTTEEINYLGGVTSNIQEQLNNKQANVTGAATTVVNNDLIESKALISDSQGKITVSDVSSTELGYLVGVTSEIQKQIDEKSDKGHDHDSRYYTEDEIDGMTFITVEDIDAIFGISDESTSDESTTE